MIEVQVWNDGTGTDEFGNYDVIVSMPGDVISVRVEGFERSRGWLALVTAAAVAAERRQDELKRRHIEELLSERPA